MNPSEYSWLLMEQQEYNNFVFNSKVEGKEGS